MKYGEMIFSLFLSFKTIFRTNSEISIKIKTMHKINFFQAAKYL